MATENFMHRQPCLLLIRHAQSQNNALGDERRVPDPNITELGGTQAAKLATAIQRLAPTKLYCSPFLRSLETARPISRVTGLTPIVRQDLYEQGGCHRGHLPGKRVAERGMGREEISGRYSGWILDPRLGSDGWYDLDHYETEDEARVRAGRVKRWFELDTNHAIEDRVAMVIHADFKMRLMEAFLGLDQTDRHFGEVVNTSVSRLSLSQGRWKLDYWNVFTHLDGEEVTT
jgi:2,3-bisphosphoglycerate-dependent phosphoglycerate mutase